jgi:hypothetical protein
VIFHATDSLERAALTIKTKQAHRVTTKIMPSKQPHHQPRGIFGILDLNGRTSPDPAHQAALSVVQR